MLPRNYSQQVCSIARALEVVGDRWTLLIMRDALQGLRRFHEFEQSLGLSKKVLADRLERLVDEEILVRRRYQDRPERYEYAPTRKGLGLWKVLALLTLWGDEHYPADGGKPRIIRHNACGGSLNGRLQCDRCGKELEPEDLELALGPALVAAGADAERYPWRRVEA